jgi:hypothetical protein
MSARDLVLVAGLLFAGAAYADAGHDHAADAPMAGAVGNNPGRQGDGSVFLPKASQRLLAIRTIVVERQALAPATTLAGRVVLDPLAAGKVQPTIPGRVEPGPNGLPTLGRAVRRGDVLGYVQPSSAAFERATQTAQAAELRSNLDVSRRRLARLEQLRGSVPQREIDALRGEVDSLTQRLAAVEGGLTGREALVAPIAGIVSSASVVSGQVVDAREVLFEIVDPTRLRVEALAYDPALPAAIDGASVLLRDGVALEVTFAGAGRVLREGALLLQFVAMLDDAAVAGPPIGQPVRVIVRTRDRVDGMRVPAGAIVKGAGNQDIVWVHEDAERFEPRLVRVVPLDGATVAVVDGLAPGERVVVQGASLVNQVR